MATARTYNEACGIPRALDRIGERWALMIVRELVLGPKRFTDLKHGLPHASPNVLAQRLKELEQSGVVRKRKLPPPASVQVYELTEWGAELDRVLLELGRWGARAPMGPEAPGMSFDSHLLSLLTLFDRERAGDFHAKLELRMGDEVFRAEVGGGKLDIRRGRTMEPDAVVETDAVTLLAISHGRRELADALAAGEIRIDRDEQAVARFVTLFTMPDPAAVPDPVAA
jgi:DNA-binding HxlR family transcriptional regulator/putative sterol carrier protein